jgi:hypothetical protein
MAQFHELSSHLLCPRQNVYTAMIKFLELMVSKDMSAQDIKRPHVCLFMLYFKPMCDSSYAFSVLFNNHLLNECSLYKLLEEGAKQVLLDTSFLLVICLAYTLTLTMDTI